MWYRLWHSSPLSLVPQLNSHSRNSDSCVLFLVTLLAMILPTGCGGVVALLVSGLWLLGAGARPLQALGWEEDVTGACLCPPPSCEGGQGRNWAQGNSTAVCTVTAQNHAVPCPLASRQADGQGLGVPVLCPGRSGGLWWLREAVEGSKQWPWPTSPCCTVTRQGQPRPL